MVDMFVVSLSQSAQSVGRKSNEFGSLGTEVKNDFLLAIVGS